MARLTILEHREIADNMMWLAFEAPADLHYEPGQFLHIRVTDGSDHLLRRPISLCKVKTADGTEQKAIVVAYRVGVRNVQQVGTRQTNLTSAREAGVECRAGGCSQIVTRDHAGRPQIQVLTLDTVEGGLQVEVLQPADIRVLWRAMFRGAVRADRESRVDLDSIVARTLADLPRAPR